MAVAAGCGGGSAMATCLLDVVQKSRHLVLDADAECGRYLGEAVPDASLSDFALPTNPIRWCLASGAETGHERNLPDNAAMAVAYGLPLEAGLRSITANAANILGMGAELGTIESGKRATLIVTDGHALEITTTVEQAWIDGRAIDLTNKQTELRDKYREKYRQLGVTRD